MKVKSKVKTHHKVFIIVNIIALLIGYLLWKNELEILQKKLDDNILFRFGFVFIFPSIFFKLFIDTFGLCIFLGNIFNFLVYILFFRKRNHS